MMKKLSEKDIRGGIFILAISLTILGLMHVLAQSTPAAANISPEVRSKVIKTITPITAAELERKIRQSNSKQTFLMVYTSWCPYCRKAIPNIIEWKNSGMLNNTQLIMLSLDKKPEDLYTYWGFYEIYKTLPSYIYTQTNKDDLSRFVGRLGMNYNGGIPYGAVFNTNGKIIAESTTGEGWADINALIVGEQY